MQSSKGHETLFMMSNLHARGIYTYHSYLRLLSTSSTSWDLACKDPRHNIRSSAGERSLVTVFGDWAWKDSEKITSKCSRFNVQNVRQNVIYTAHLPEATPTVPFLRQHGPCSQGDQWSSLQSGWVKQTLQRITTMKTGNGKQAPAVKAPTG